MKNSSKSSKRIDESGTISVCQRRGCQNDGKPRTQIFRRSQGRVIYLCGECFESIPVHRLRDLFLEAGNKKSWQAVSTHEHLVD